PPSAAGLFLRTRALRPASGLSIARPPAALDGRHPMGGSGRPLVRWRKHRPSAVPFQCPAHAERGGETSRRGCIRQSGPPLHRHSNERSHLPVQRTSRYRQPRSSLDRQGRHRPSVDPRFHGPGSAAEAWCRCRVGIH
ncbi:hypothetical protein ACHAPB_009247, partial [Verticillium nonalfalfae]